MDARRARSALAAARWCRAWWRRDGRAPASSAAADLEHRPRRLVEARRDHRHGGGRLLRQRPQRHGRPAPPPGTAATASPSAAAPTARGNAITLPNNLLSGLEDVTVDFDVWVDPSLTSGNWFMYNLGNAATYPNGTGYLFTTNDSTNRLRSTIAEGGFATEQSAVAARPGPDRAVAPHHLQHRRRHPRRPGRGPGLRGRRAGRVQHQPHHQPAACSASPTAPPPATCWAARPTPATCPSRAGCATSASTPGP